MSSRKRDKKCEGRPPEPTVRDPNKTTNLQNIQSHLLIRKIVSLFIPFYLSIFLTFFIFSSFFGFPKILFLMMLFYLSLPTTLQTGPIHTYTLMHDIVFFNIFGTRRKIPCPYIIPRIGMHYTFQLIVCIIAQFKYYVFFEIPTNIPHFFWSSTQPSPPTLNQRETSILFF